MAIRVLCSMLLLVQITLAVGQQPSSDTVPINEEFASLLAKYNKGDRDSAFLEEFIKVSLRSKQHSMADEATKAYIDEQEDGDLYSKDCLTFLSRVTNLVSDPAYGLFDRNRMKVDEIVGPATAERVVDRAITASYIDPIAFPDEKPANDEPNWNALATEVMKHASGDDAACAISRSAAIWNLRQSHWSASTKYTLKTVKECGQPRSNLNINAIAWTLFQNVNDRSVLQQLLPLMEGWRNARPDDENATDTYANLLYKVGKSGDAISWETKAVELAQKHGNKDPGFAKTLDKMRHGLPTWSN